MTSDGSLSNNLRVIGELERPDHWHLNADDECYFFGDYTPGGGYSHSAANQLVINLKRHPKFRGKPAWRHKVRAIQTCGTLLGRTLNTNLASNSVIVPIPPSKPPDHPEFDDRMIQIAMNSDPFRHADLIRNTTARSPLHHSDQKRDIDAIYSALAIDLADLGDATTCFLLDDVLTTGASFRACVRKIGEIDQIKRVVGVFIARCARPRVEFPMLDIPSKN